MTDLEQQLDALSDGELLLALNNTLAKRALPATPEQVQAAADAAEWAAEYEQFFPGSKP